MRRVGAQPDPPRREHLPEQRARARTLAKVRSSPMTHGRACVLTRWRNEKCFWVVSPTRGLRARNRVFRHPQVGATDAARPWRSKEVRLGEPCERLAKRS